MRRWKATAAGPGLRRFNGLGRPDEGQVRGLPSEATMNHHLLKLALAAAGLLLLGQSAAQVNEVPMKGLGNEWVKELDLKGRMDWEWIETYTDEVYFATRQDFERAGDIVTMWTRIEYRVPQESGAYRSAASRDQWDCAAKRKANVRTVYYRWKNLDDNEATPARANLTDWQVVEPGTLGETLLDFACSLGR
jgi:hypothetical protein